MSNNNIEDVEFEEQKPTYTLNSSGNYWIQVRIQDNGPKNKSDGKKGRVILESTSSSHQVLQWFKQCTKATKKSGPEIYLYVNGEELISEEELNGDPNDVLEDIGQLDLNTQNGIVYAHSYLRRLENDIQIADNEKAKLYGEIALLREQKTKEIEFCNSQIEKARAHHDSALTTYQNNAMSFSKLAFDEAKNMIELRKVQEQISMLHPPPPPKEWIAAISDGANTVMSNPLVQHLLMSYAKSKGMPVE